MTDSYLFYLLIVLLFCSQCKSIQIDESQFRDEWQSLFNGKDIDD
ncbi:MAG: hypothetical protein ACJA01_003796, partial [Saprospiraceae bacterium]